MSASLAWRSAAADEAPGTFKLNLRKWENEGSQASSRGRRGGRPPGGWRRAAGGERNVTE